MKRRRCLLFTSAPLALLLGTPSLARADAFAEARLARGIDAVRTKRYSEASDQFRIACFGLLDEPILLTEGLVRLTLAQEAAGRRADVEKTLERFLDVERRFAVYAKSRLDAPTREGFQALLRARLPADVIAAVPSLAALSGKTGDPGAETRKKP